MGDDEGRWTSSNRRDDTACDSRESAACPEIAGFGARLHWRGAFDAAVVCFLVLACLGPAQGRPVTEDNWHLEPNTIDRSFSDVAEKLKGAETLQLVSVEELVRTLAGTNSRHSIAEKLAKGEQGSFFERLHTEVANVLEDAPELQLQWRTGRFETLALNPQSGEYFNCIASHSGHLHPHPPCDVLY